jgi:hypothetical protein
MLYLTENTAYGQCESQPINAPRETTGVYFYINSNHTVWQYTKLFDVTADGAA